MARLIRQIMSKPRFVSWAAVSSLPQAKKISLEDQLKTNREHVERWGGALVAELIVPGKSRSIVLFEDACAHIEAYQQLRELIEQRAFDVLIFLDRSRLGRTASLTMTISELCERAGIICYATESPPANLDSEAPNIAQKLTEAFQSVMTREEIAKLMRRHEMGMKARVMRGDFPGGVPWGWKTIYELVDDKPVARVEVDEEAASTIRTMVDLFLRRGLGYYQIATELRALGLTPPQGGEWSKAAVVNILGQVWRYAGIIELNKRKDSKRPYVRAKSKWPAIIPEEAAQAVSDERKRRGQHRRPNGSLHRFSLLVFCGQCGRRMAGTWATVPSRHGNDKTYNVETFKCRSYDGYVTHPNSNISGKFITNAVHDAIEFVQNKKNLDIVAGAKVDRNHAINTAIAQIEARIKKNAAALQRADDQFVDGTMDMERYKRQVARLREQWEKLNGDLARQRELLDKEQHDAARTERLLEIANVGIEMLESEDILAANAWFLRHIRIEIHAHTENRIRVFYL